MTRKVEAEPQGLITDIDGPQIMARRRETLVKVGDAVAGRYMIRRALGGGGMGAVFCAFDRELGEEVALKFLRPDLGLSHPAIERFRREVKLARKVSHPSVCRVHDLGEYRGRRFLTMALVPGGSLRDLLSAEPPPPLARRLAIWRDIVSGVAAAHAFGVTHGDIKPENVVVRADDGRAVIVDFGVSWAPTEGDPRSLGLAGTRSYMAPELFDGGALNPRCDVFALGLVGRELLSSEADRDSVIVSSLVSVLDRATTVVPEARFSDGRELLDALDAACAGASTGVGSARAATALPRRRRRVFVVGLAAVASVGVAGLTLASFPRGDSRATRTQWNERPAVLVMRYVNATGIPRWDATADPLAHNFQRAIAADPRFIVMANHVDGDPVELSRSSDATWTVTGSIQLVDGKPHVVTEILYENLATPYVLDYPLRAEAVDADVADVQAAVLGSLRQLFEGHVRRQWAKHTTSVTEAMDALLDYYALAEGRETPYSGAIHSHQYETLLDARVRLLRTAIAADPRFAQARAEYGMLLVNWYLIDPKEGYLRDGIAELKRANQLYPEHPVVALALCSASTVLVGVDRERELVAGERPDRTTAESCAEAARLNPYSANTAAALARLYDSEYRLPEAMKTYDRASELDGLTVPVFGTEWLDLGFQSDRPEVADRISLVLLDAFRREQRFETIGVTLAARSIGPVALLGRAVALIGLRRGEEARALLAEYFTLARRPEEEAAGLVALARVDTLSSAQASRLEALEGKWVESMRPHGFGAVHVRRYGRPNLTDLYRWVDPQRAVRVARAIGASATCADVLWEARTIARYSRTAALHTLDKCHSPSTIERLSIDTMRVRLGQSPSNDRPEP